MATHNTQNSPSIKKPPYPPKTPSLTFLNVKDLHSMKKVITFALKKTMEEIWKDIKGYEGKYQVSNYGRVKSLNYRNTGKERLLKSNQYTNGYFWVMLYKPKKRFSIHRLVAEEFIPNPNNLPCVNHKDENPTNNHVDNLEWCTYKYNNEYGTRLKRVSESLLNHPKISKKVYQYTLDGKLVREWDSTQECGRNGFDQAHIASCCRGGFIRKGKWVNVTQHRGYRWSY